MPFQNDITVLEILSPYDWLLFFFILLFTVVIVLMSHHFIKKGNDFLDYIVLGRKLTLPFFIGTLVSTWYGGIFGVAEIAFNNGIYNYVTQGFFWYLTYLIFAFFIVPKVKKSRSVTLPSFIKEKFGEKSGKVATLLNFFNVLPIAYTLSLGLFIQLIFPIPLWIAMSLGSTVLISYSIWGGFRAVVFSDFLQFLTMCTGVAFVLVFSIQSFGGLEFLQNGLPSFYFSPTGKHDWGQTLVWGFIALSTLVDPNFYQRVFAAKNSKTARNGILFATLTWMCFDLCTTLGAMYAKAVIPNAESSKAYFIYSIQLLPSPLKGFFLASILATILSTLDSYLFLASSTISYDFLKSKNTKKHYYSFISVAVLSIIFALTFDGNIKSIWKAFGSLSSACLLIPVTSKVLFKFKVTDKSFVLSCIASSITLFYWKFFSPIELNFLDELYPAMLVSFLIIFFRRKKE